MFTTGTPDLSLVKYVRATFGTGLELRHPALIHTTLTLPPKLDTLFKIGDAFLLKRAFREHGIAGTKATRVCILLLEGSVRE